MIQFKWRLTAEADTAAMVLTPEQHSQIATAYESAAADEMVPPPHRAAFARKADWFRLLARVAEKKAGASKEERPKTLAELLKWVRAAPGA